MAAGEQSLSTILMKDIDLLLGASVHEFDVSGAEGIIVAGLPNFFSMAAFSYAYPLCFFPFYDKVCWFSFYAW